MVEMYLIEEKQNKWDLLIIVLVKLQLLAVIIYFRPPSILILGGYLNIFWYYSLNFSHNILYIAVH